MFAPQARWLSTWFDQVDSVGTMMSLLSVSRHIPTNFSFWGVERFEMDGAADEVALEPPPSTLIKLLGW
jgi:hypothetical protein